MYRGILAVLLILVLVAIGGGIANQAYHAGVARGLAESGKLAPGAGPYLPYGYGYGPFLWHGPGFGFFGFLFPLLFFFLIFALLKGLFWGGHGGWGHRWRYGHPGEGVPPWFEEWHRRAHEERRGTGTA